MRFALFCDKITSRSSTLCTAPNDQRLWPDNLLRSRCSLIWNDKRCRPAISINLALISISISVFFHLYLQQAIEMSQRLIKALAAAWEDPDPFDISPILFAISHLLAQISVGQLVPIDFNSWPTNSH